MLAQNTLSVSTPTPQAAALAKFSETPVSLYTGIPSISIPIYEVKLRGVTLPVSLNYHAGGIRVPEVASSVGLGWALQAGGTISSTVMGRDDFSGTGFLNTYKFPTDRRLLPIRNSGTTDYEFCRLATGTPVAGTPSWAIPESGFDTQPDLFYYNFCGRSGKFFYTQDSKAHTTPFEPINIDHKQGYTITDETGNRYFFNDVEVATTSITRHGGSSSQQEEGVTLSSVYYLSKVETPYHETITLAYDTIAYDYANLGSYTRYITLNNQVGSNPESCLDRPATSTETLTRVAGLQIASIRSSRGDFVEFEYSSCQRLDLHKGRALKKVKIHTGQHVRTFALGYGYFNFPTAASDCAIPTYLDTRESYRLKLATVTEEGKPSYKIRYNAATLPSRLAQSQDHWGFYNGSTGGLLPAEPDKGFYTGGDRTPDALHMQAGIIKSLEYPTGGRTEFEFEPNTYYTPPGSITYDSTVVGVHITSANDNDEPVSPSSHVLRSDTFTIPASVYQASIKILYKTGCGYGDNRATPQFSPVLSSIPSIMPPIAFNPSPTAPQPTEVSQRLASGRYAVTAEITGDCPNDYFILQWTQTRTKPIPAVNLLAGGLRIREVRDYASGSSEPLRRRYRYCEPNDTTRSSGKVLYLPKYSYQKNEYTRSARNQDVITGTCHYMVQSSSSVQPLSAVQGGSVAYTAIQVMKDSKGEQGMTAHLFSWADDYKLYDGYPFTPATSLDWQRGLPLQTIDYAYDNATARYQPVRKVKNQYRHNYTPPTNYSCNDCANYIDPTEPNEAHVLGLNIIAERPEAFVPLSDWAPPVLSPAQFLIESYKYTSVWSYLTQKEEYVYNPLDTTQYQLTRTSYTYANPAHAQLTRTQTVSSGYDTLTTRNLYALDYDTTHATTPVALGIRGLAREHRMTELIERQQWGRKGNINYLLSGQLTHYEIGKPSRDLVLQTASPVPAADFTSSAISQGEFRQDWRYRPSLAYERYDGLGNILQARQAHGTAQSFLWGYAATQPIAKAINAEYGQLAYTSFEPGSAGRWHFAPTGITMGGHTGNWCHTLASPVSRDSLPAGNYQLTFWASATPSIYLNGNLVPATAGRAVSRVTEAGLQQFIYTLRATATLNEVKLQATQPLRLDELRLHPVGAQLTTYTHEPLLGLTSQTDAAGRTTRYEYDALGRLLRTRDEGGNIITQQEYHYARP